MTRFTPLFCTGHGWLNWANQRMSNEVTVFRAVFELPVCRSKAKRYRPSGHGQVYWVWMYVYMYIYIRVSSSSLGLEYRAHIALRVPCTLQYHIRSCSLRTKISRIDGINIFWLTNWWMDWLIDSWHGITKFNSPMHQNKVKRCCRVSMYIYLASLTNEVVIARQLCPCAFLLSRHRGLE